MNSWQKPMQTFVYSFINTSVFLSMLSATNLIAQDAPLGPGVNQLNDEQVVEFVDLVLAGIEREFPNKPGNVLATVEDVQSPQEMHPVFYGCFDWHSSVHGHWVLVRLLKLYPENGRSSKIRELLSKQFTAEKLAKEASYFDAKTNKSFERMYGWAWVFRLAAELKNWDDEDAKRWSKNLEPLEHCLVDLAKGYLPRLTFPIRTGQHPDTGFALAQALDYARETGDREFEEQISEFAISKYSKDVDYPARYEPSGHDFFSTCLNEADLMRRVLSQAEFSEWLNRFLPELDQANGTARSLLTPAEVSDVTDGKLVHLAGLNFNRGWTQAGILAALPENDPRAEVLRKSISEHRDAGMKYVFSGSYEGEHWLATFAVYLLTGTGIKAL